VRKRGITGRCQRSPLDLLASSAGFYIKFSRVHHQYAGLGTIFCVALFSRTRSRLTSSFGHIKERPPTRTPPNTRLTQPFAFSFPSTSKDPSLIFPAHLMVAPLSYAVRSVSPSFQPSSSAVISLFSCQAPREHPICEPFGLTMAPFRPHPPSINSLPTTWRGARFPTAQQSNGAPTCSCTSQQTRN
jgi:hypothetical protein